jgi:hypothetical protein
MLLAAALLGAGVALLTARATAPRPPGAGAGAPPLGPEASASGSAAVAGPTAAGPASS